MGSCGSTAVYPLVANKDFTILSLESEAETVEAYLKCAGERDVAIRMQLLGKIDRRIVEAARGERPLMDRDPLDQRVPLVAKDFRGKSLCVRLFCAPGILEPLARVAARRNR